MTTPLPPDTDTVLLDLDGTLVDSVHEHVLAWKLAFQRVGVEVPSTRLHRAIGMAGEQLVTAVAGSAVETGVGDVVRDLHDEFFAQSLAQVRALPGAGELVQRIHAGGRKVVITTGSPPEVVDRMLDLLEQPNSIDHVLTSEAPGQGKPAPDTLLEAMRIANSRSAVLVGDAVWDVLAAVAADIPCIGLRSGGMSEAELREAGAVLVLEDADELVGDLDRLFPPRTTTM